MSEQDGREQVVAAVSARVPPEEEHAAPLRASVELEADGGGRRAVGGIDATAKDQYHGARC